MDHQYRQPSDEYRRLTDFSMPHARLTHEKRRTAPSLTDEGSSAGDPVGSSTASKLPSLAAP
jgi:hypothetical protein